MCRPVAIRHGAGAMASNSPRMPAHPWLIPGSSLLLPRLIPGAVAFGGISPLVPSPLARRWPQGDPGRPRATEGDPAVLSSPATFPCGAWHCQLSMQLKSVACVAACARSGRGVLAATQSRSSIDWLYLVGVHNQPSSHRGKRLGGPYLVGACSGRSLELSPLRTRSQSATGSGWRRA